jgi:hypothetical protein
MLRNVPLENCSKLHSSLVCRMLALLKSDPNRKGWHLTGVVPFFAPRRPERQAKLRAESGFCGITTRVTENPHLAASSNAATGGNLGPFSGEGAASSLDHKGLGRRRIDLPRYFHCPAGGVPCQESLSGLRIGLSRPGDARSATGSWLVSALTLTSHPKR